MYVPSQDPFYLSLSLSLLICPVASPWWISFTKEGPMYLDDILHKTLCNLVCIFLSFSFLSPAFVPMCLVKFSWETIGKRCKLSLWLGYHVTVVCPARLYMTIRVCLMLSPHSCLKLFFPSSTVPLPWKHPYVSSPLGMALPFMKIFIIILLSLCSHLSDGLKIAGILLLVREVTVSGVPGGHYVILHIHRNLFNVLSVSRWSKIPLHHIMPTVSQKTVISLVNQLLQ